MTNEDDLKKIDEREQEILKIVSESIWNKPEVIRSLVIENAAMKAVLFQKGIITPDEFKGAMETMTAMIDATVKSKVDEWKRNHPLESVLLDIFAGKNKEK